MTKTLTKFKSKVRSIRESSKARRTPTGYKFLISDSIHFFDESMWRSATEDASLFLKKHYLEVLEAFPPENVSLKYVLIFEGITPVGAAVFQLVSLTAKELGTKKPFSKVKQKLLVCGNLLSWGNHGVYFKPGSNHEALWLAVGEALYKIRRAEKLSGQAGFVLVKDLCERDGSSPRALKKLGYKVLETEPNMVLKIPVKWKSYDDYLQNLQKKYRRNVEKLHEEVKKGGCEIKEVSDLTPYRDAIFGLYLEVHDKAKVKPITINPDYLPSLQSALGRKMRTSIIEREGNVVGFIVTLNDGDTAVPYYIGFDRKASADLPLYLRLLHESIKHSIEFGCKEASFGRTALEPKAALGAEPVPFQAWIRHRQAVMNVLVTNLLRAVPHAEAPERHPFKEQ